jgi:protein arginine N-methyltransferase 1
MRAGLRSTVNTWRKGRVKPEQLLTEPKCWATLNYTTLGSPNVSGHIESIIRKAGTGHGLIVWFDAELFDGVSFSNAPGAPELIYGSAFFPWPASVSCDVGDAVSIALRANLVGDDYIWSWNTCVRNQGNPEHVKANFKQSTFLADPLSSTVLRKRASNHRPTLNDYGRIEQRTLELMNGENSLEQIAKQLAGEFSGRFISWYEALNHISDVSEKYSR